MISDLLSKTPGETGLYRKYQIACASLIRWYEEGSRQHKILTEFIQIIADAIKEAEGTTNGQISQPIQGAIKPEVTTNSQSIQTIGDAIEAEGTTNRLESLMKRLAKISRLLR